jgi:glutamyl-tRNA reductase
MSEPILFLVGATHRSAPFAFREKIALGAEAEAALAADLKRSPAVREFVVLNTCNRVEIYAVGANPAAGREIVALFCAQRHVPVGDFEEFGIVRRDRDVVDHLCQVASGLDSQILGETEIFGQVKRAYANAQTRATAGPILNRLFQKAFQAAKHVRANTGITTGQVSVANVAVDLALSIFGGVERARLLVIGAGEMAEKAAKAFQGRGTQSIEVTNRDLARAASLAETLHAQSLPFDQRETALVAADIVVCSTSSPGTVISSDAVRAAMAQRRSRPLLLIDLAMPRDIDSVAGKLENVYLYNLDDLALVAAKNREARLMEAETGRAALTQRASALWLQLQLQLAILSGARHAEAPFSAAAVPA